MRMWKCTKCMTILPLTKEYFALDKRIKRGYKSFCKKCHNLQQMKYRTTDAYREAHSKAKRKWRKDNPEHLQKQMIRKKTREKYGKPPKGYEYHHEPYHIDSWELISKKDHYKLHNKGGGY